MIMQGLIDDVINFHVKLANIINEKKWGSSLEISSIILIFIIGLNLAK
jgi:hypothetical protein